MADELTIVAEIEAVLADRPRPSLDQLEHTLTTGYAAALALEARRWRLERRLADAAARLGAGGDAEAAGEVAGLARELGAADADVKRLRRLLDTLRDRAAAARAAA